jgi:hypothetical protein
MYGDPHHRLTDVIWGHVQNFVALNPSTPFFCMGDMNELMHAYDKIGPSAADFHRMNSFCTHVKRCGFVDLGYDGPAYTWTNKHFSSIPTFGPTNTFLPFLLMNGLIVVLVMQNGV